MNLPEFYRNKHVLVTGHTGFKGAWLSLWLAQMGCRVTGYSLAAAAPHNNLYSLLGLDAHMESHIGDIRDMTTLHQTIEKAKPDILFHLAAQALVLPSYASPIDTYSTNIMGTINLLECVRMNGSIKAVINVTTDKCYENTDSAIPFREQDPLGGYDPYSSSKAAVEIVYAAYRRSFLSAQNIHMATARAGNVIGGGDFSAHRLIPDMVRAANAGKSVSIRHPESTRPWQYVLDALHGYLMLGQKLYQQGAPFAEAFNFGPDEVHVTVGALVDRFEKVMQPLIPAITYEPSSLHEAQSLSLDTSKAKSTLGWRPLVTTHEAIDRAAAWYRHYITAPEEIGVFTENQLRTYCQEHHV
jgi:CDP-glucose 4,6-dehydratase